MVIEPGDFLLCNDRVYDIVGIYEVLIVVYDKVELIQISGKGITDISADLDWIYTSGNYRKLMLEE